MDTAFYPHPRDPRLAVASSLASLQTHLYAFQGAVIHGFLPLAVMSEIRNLSEEELAKLDNRGSHFENGTLFQTTAQQDIYTKAPETLAFIHAVARFLQDEAHGAMLGVKIVVNVQNQYAHVPAFHYESDDFCEDQVLHAVCSFDMDEDTPRQQTEWLNPQGLQEKGHLAQLHKKTPWADHPLKDRIQSVQSRDLLIMRGQSQYECDPEAHGVYHRAPSRALSARRVSFVWGQFPKPLL